MTTQVQARDAIVSFINDNFSDLPVFYENTEEVDLDATGDRFLRVEIDFLDCYQTTLGDAAGDRTVGAIMLCVYTKVGKGVRTTLEVLDTLKAMMKRRTLDGVVIETPRPGEKVVNKGWESRELVIPFRFDSFG